MAKPVDDTTLERQPTMEPPAAPRGPSAYLLVIAGPSFGEMHRLQGEPLGDRPRRHRRYSRARRRHLARARRGRARRRQEPARRSRVDQRDVLQRSEDRTSGAGRRRQDLRRRVDDPEVHLSGPGRRALSEAPLRVGAPGRADLDVQPPLLRRSAQHRDAVRRRGTTSRWRCCSSTSITSRRSTTASGTRRGTTCWRRWRAR